MKKNVMKQYASAMLIIGAILIVLGGYQMYHPVLAVSEHDESADMRRMFATTTFEVISSVSCDTLDMNLLMTYDNNPQNGVIDMSELFAATDDVESGAISVGDYNQIKLAYTNTCKVDLPLSPARINDDTDTLTTDKSEYSPGESVVLSARGKNIGGATWNGKIEFRTTSPSVKVVSTKTGLSISPGHTYMAVRHWKIPTTAAAGTYTIQSRWIDDDGTVHALSSIDLGTTEVAGMDVNVLGALGATAGILLLLGGLWARRD